MAVRNVCALDLGWLALLAENSDFMLLERIAEAGRRLVLS
jgi:hypothetical protein